MFRAVNFIPDKISHVALRDQYEVKNHRASLVSVTVVEIQAFEKLPIQEVISASFSRATIRVDYNSRNQWRLSHISLTSSPDVSRAERERSQGIRFAYFPNPLGSIVTNKSSCLVSVIHSI